MEDIDKLKTKRKTVRTASTKLINKVNLLLESYDVKKESDQEKLSEHLLNVEAKQIELKGLNNAIEKLITDSALYEDDIQNSFEYDEQLNEVKFKIKSKIEKFKAASQPIPPPAISPTGFTNVRSNYPVTSINLPKLRIPTFSGDSSTFLEFINSFTNAIDANESLSKVDKFIYLKSFLSGEAYKIVSGFSLTEENYKSCLDMLKDRYGRQDHLISHFINRLLEIEPVKSSFNLRGLRKLYDESEISIRNLNSMGIASGNYGHLLIPILLKQLPQDLVIGYHLKRDSKKTGDVNELMKFIKFEIEARESANIVAGHSHKVSEIPRYSSRNSYYQSQPKIKNNIPSSTALYTVANNVCIFCKSESHTALKCKTLSNEQKRYKLKKEGFCYRCMSYKHLMSQCKVKISPCETCQSPQHNSLFCSKNKIKKSPTSNPENETNHENETRHEKEVVMSSVLNSQDSPNSYATLLQTARVQVGTGENKVLARLLFDSGSQKSFVRNDLKQTLKLKTIRKEKLLIYTFSKREPMEKDFDVVNLKITSRFPPYQSIDIEALASDEITGANLYSTINPENILNILPASCLISDPYDKSKQPIQILIGADYLYNALLGEAIKIKKNLFIQPTVFGDTLIGQLTALEEIKQTSIFNVSCSVIENDLKCLWQIDSLLDDSSKIKPSESLINFGKELEIKNKRYMCPLQWKSEQLRKNLSNNLDVAKKRFASLEKRFNSDESLFENYNAVMKEQFEEKIIEICSDKCFIGYVMPHREVFRESSSSSKTRIVYDASSKLGTNVSLNECLDSGENLNPNLIDVILKFREHKIAFCGDIARAFLQIQVTESDRNFLCFLYYKNCDKTLPVTMYHFNRHCFGVTCSPFVLAATIKTHIKEYKDKHPLAYQMLNESLYVDDLFFGSSTVQEAFKLSSDAVSILKDANMNMRKFDTNSKELKNLWRNSNSNIEINEHSDYHLKVLGLVWNNIDDTLGLDLRSLLSNLNDNECTKRNVLHTAAKIFDPSGFISPFLIRITSKDLITSEKWWHGPDWLKNNEDLWPKTKGFEYEPIDSEVTTEFKSSVIVSTAIVQEKIMDPGKFSCLQKLLRVTAWILRFVNALKRKNTEKGPLASEELANAEMFWVKIVQNDSYSSEITCLKNNKALLRDSKLLCLNPFLDSNGVLRVTGRLGKSTQLSTFEKHPIILPSKAKLTELLIWDSHTRVFHSGVSHTLVQVREKYWILKARQTIKSLLGKCTICKRFNSSPGSQVIAPLPDIRVEQSAPFTIIGVDFAGPLFVKDSDTKHYILLLTCAVTRSVHLELVGDMTTDTFLLAFRRFISRRGLCSVVISDNARTFKRAELEIKLIWKVLNHPDVKNFYSANGIKWQYIVERAAWWGGFYERMVRTVKTALRKTLGKSCLTVEQLQTVLIEIEGMINSRPITYVGSDSDEPTALTPAHFLLGKRITSLPSVRLHLDSNLSSRKCLIKAFNYREKLMRSFWTRWKNEYLLNLRSAHSSSVKSSSPFKVNDVVLIKDDHLPRNFWKLGKILELFPGRDGKVRACKVKTESATIKRPIQLLYNLEIQD